MIKILGEQVPIQIEAVLNLARSFNSSIYRLRVDIWGDITFRDFWGSVSLPVRFEGEVMKAGKARAKEIWRKNTDKTLEFVIEKSSEVIPLEVRETKEKMPPAIAKALKHIDSIHDGTDHVEFKIWGSSVSCTYYYKEGMPSWNGKEDMDLLGAAKIEAGKYLNKIGKTKIKFHLKDA